ncbi:Smg-4/UPF3 family-domain-containing protein [Phellopilus nigrolimitatus]|nr:Smg-4/UPF3 family-domain-containing protein [Phellopilus nigrolimitatus]
MATTTATTETNNKAKLPKTKAERKAAAAQPNNVTADKLKTVVRRLPPNLPEDIFWQSVQPWVTDETASWKTFYPGKIRKKYNKENVPSRAYIAFRDAEQLAIFGQAYDGHLFRDKAVSTGNESYAVVEFAPHQKVPPEKKKADPRNGTIEQDEDYISYVASFNAPPKPSESDALETLIAASQHTTHPQEPKSTPLLDALRAEKQAQRDRETILKAHAHYHRASGRDIDKGIDDASTRRRGKQPQTPAQAERDEGGSAPGQGKRNRRGGAGRKAETIAAKEKEAVSVGSPKASAITQIKGQPKPSRNEASPAAPTPTAPVAAAKGTVKDMPQERRPRPAIGMRQFEAALSGAGVVASSGSERRSRREREREKKAPEGTAPTSGEGPPKADKLLTPASPGKERNRGGRKRGDSVKGPSHAVINPPPGGAPPTILSRTDTPASGSPRIIARPAGVDATAVSGSGGKQGGGSPTGGEGRGGRRRGGRGRGPPPVQTGRGGAPDVAAA